MIKTVSALLLGASVLAAAPAGAARYITYTVHSRGYGTVTALPATAGGPLTDYAIYDADLTFSIDTLGAAGGTGATGNGINTFAYTNTAGQTATTLSVTDTFDFSVTNTGTSGRVLIINANGSACGNFAGVFPMPGDTQAVNASCSTFAASSVEQFAGGRTITFSGDISLIRATSSDTAPQTLGFISLAPGVPEPATWAMMLIGFAAVGFSMRRHRVATTWASAA